MDEYLPLREVVFEALRDAIVHGEFEPGERLLEVALANVWVSAGLRCVKQSGCWN